MSRAILTLCGVLFGLAAVAAVVGENETRPIAATGVASPETSAATSSPELIEIPVVPPVPSASTEKLIEQPEPPLTPEAPPSSLETTNRSPTGGSPRFVIPAGRPSWVATEPIRKGLLHQTAVASDPFATPGECREALETKLRAAVDEYVNFYLGREDAASRVPVADAFIREHLVKEEYPEVLEFPFGPMHQIHALVQFDAAFRDTLDRRWLEVKRTSRAEQTTLLALGVLGLLGIGFSYLRMDTATRGYYTSRLQVAAALAILGWMVGSIFLARWIPWL